MHLTHACLSRSHSLKPASCASRCRPLAQVAARLAQAAVARSSRSSTRSSRSSATRSSRRCSLVPPPLLKMFGSHSLVPQPPPLACAVAAARSCIRRCSLVQQPPPHSCSSRRHPCARTLARSDACLLGRSLGRSLERSPNALPTLKSCLLWSMSYVGCKRVHVNGAYNAYQGTRTPGQRAAQHRTRQHRTRQQRTRQQRTRDPPATVRPPPAPTNAASTGSTRYMPTSSTRYRSMYRSVALDLMCCV